MNVEIPGQGLRVVRLDAPENRESALLLAERTFGHLDLGDLTVRDELVGVSWNRSVGVIGQDGECHAFLLAAPIDIPDYAATRSDLQGFSPGAFDDMNSLRGDALVVEPLARHLAPSMLRRFVSHALQDGSLDYVWGTAHADLGNQDFWSRHAIIIGDHEDGEIVFVIPVSDRARVACRDCVQVPTEAPRIPGR